MHQWFKKADSMRVGGTVGDMCAVSGEEREKGAYVDGEFNLGG